MSAFAQSTCPNAAMVWRAVSPVPEPVLGLQPLRISSRTAGFGTKRRYNKKKNMERAGTMMTVNSQALWTVHPVPGEERLWSETRNASAASFLGPWTGTWCRTCEDLSIARARYFLSSKASRHSSHDDRNCEQVKSPFKGSTPPHPADRQREL